MTALADWLLAQPGVERVVARDVELGNAPSRRALERAGFALERAGERRASYARRTTNVNPAG